jgi:hypothetical protein
MKRATILMSALAVVLYTIGISAQANPSFAGKWTMDAPAAAPGGGAPGGGGGGRGGRGGGGPVSGMEVTITQDATSLTIDKVQAGRGGAEPTPIKLTYKLDGSETKNSVAMRGATVEQTSKAVWEAGKLTISTTSDFGNGPMTTKQTLSLEGGNLVVQNIGADGTPGAKLTYKKAM